LKPQFKTQVKITFIPIMRRSEITSELHKSAKNRDLNGILRQQVEIFDLATRSNLNSDDLDFVKKSITRSQITADARSQITADARSQITADARLSNKPRQSSQSGRESSQFDKEEQVLSDMSKILDNLKGISNDINCEIVEQKQLVSNLDDGLDTAQTQLDNVIKKLEKIQGKYGKNTPMWAIIGLVILSIALLITVIYI
jgi:vacuolar-type H+-ATPase subunit I/STV1